MSSRLQHWVSQEHDGWAGKEPRELAAQAMASFEEAGEKGVERVAEADTLKQQLADWS